MVVALSIVVVALSIVVVALSIVVVALSGRPVVDFSFSVVTSGGSIVGLSKEV